MTLWSLKPISKYKIILVAYLFIVLFFHTIVLLFTVSAWQYISAVY
jgi:hypothetical protein